MLRLASKMMAVAYALLWLAASTAVAQAPPPSGQRLRALAGNFPIGFAAASNFWSLPDAAQYEFTASSEFSMLTPENQLKWDTTEPQQNVFNFAPGDMNYQYAQQNGMVFHGHTLVWHNQLPGWLTGGSWTSGQLTAILKNHIDNEVGHYKGEIAFWDVVNEAFNDDGTRRASIWQNTIGPSYIEIAFQEAHNADPNVILVYNDFNIETINAKSNAVYAMVQDFQSRGIPIDGIGLQTHLTAGGLDYNSLAANMQRFADLGLKIYISEMDVREPVSNPDFQGQATAYYNVLDKCLLQPACKGFTIWGFTDKYSWVPGTFPGFGVALPFDQNYNPKPAYYALQTRLAALADFSLSVSNPVQTVLAGQSATFNGMLATINGYSNSVSVTCNNGAPATCSSATLTPTSGGAAFSITASNPAGGDFNFNLVATGSDSQPKIHQQAVTLHVSDFTMGVSNLTQTVLAGQTATFNGTLTAINAYSNSVTVTCGGAAPGACSTTMVTPTPAGAAFSITTNTLAGGDFTFNLVAQGSDSQRLTRVQTVTLHISDFAVVVSNPIQTVLAGSTVTFNGTLTAINGYSNAVTVSCGSGAPTTCAPATLTPTAGGAPFSITAGNPAGGDFVFNLVATGSDAQTITHLQQVTLHVSDFAVSVPYPEQTVLAGNNATFNGMLLSQNGYNSQVTVSCGSGAPPVCPAASPVTPIAGGAPFSITASSNTLTTYNFNLTATGSDANTLVHNQPVTLNVVNVSTDLAVGLGRSPAARYVAFGTPVTYTATVTNNGPATTVAKVILIFPMKVRIASMDGACSGSGPILCTSPSLAMSAQASFNVTVLAPLTHAMQATASVFSSTAAESNPADNIDRNSVRIYLRPFRRSLTLGAP